MNTIGRNMFPDKAILFDAGKCTNEKCQKVVTTPYEFRDRESARECELSGMCQECQDEFFGK